MRRFLPVLLGISLILLLIAVKLNKSQNVSAAPATHVVISEIQIEGPNGINDEFVELYNPTDSIVNLTGWRLTRRTSSGTQNTLVNNISGIVPAHGFFLIVHSASYSGSISPDILYSAPSQNIASNNSVVLYSDAGITQVDLVGMGTATATETAATSIPTPSLSIERKANSSSNSTSMAIGGIDALLGNGEDTDNNTNDFVVRNIPQPQNSTSSIELLVVPTPSPTLAPTASPIPTSTPTPTIEPSPTPTISPSPIPSPTLQPSPTLTLAPTGIPSITPIAPSITPVPTLVPTTVPSQTPSVTPTTGPTINPSPTIQPSPMVTPSISPNPPSPTPIIIARGPNFICSLHQKSVRFFHRTFFFPFIKCVKL